MVGLVVVPLTAEQVPEVDMPERDMPELEELGLVEALEKMEEQEHGEAPGALADMLDVDKAVAVHIEEPGSHTALAVPEAD